MNVHQFMCYLQVTIKFFVSTLNLKFCDSKHLTVFLRRYETEPGQGNTI